METTCPWDDWKAQAVAQGVPENLAELGRLLIREAAHRCWPTDVREQAGMTDGGTRMLELALTHPKWALRSWKCRKLAFGVERSHRAYRLRLARYPTLVRMLGESLPPGPATVLDAGCGKGRVPRYWRKAHPDRRSVRFVGIDLSPRRLGFSRGHYEPLVRADLLGKWPFADAFFDAVICEQVLEHFTPRETRSILLEIRRVLKPGAIALIGTPVFSRSALAILPVVLRLRRLLAPGNGASPVHLQHFHRASLYTLLTESGLIPETVRGSRLFAFPLNCLEDFRWWYRLHRWIGARFPSLCTEVTVCSRRK